MSASGLWNAPRIVPALTYSDLPRAIEWLELRLASASERMRA